MISFMVNIPLQHCSKQSSRDCIAAALSEMLQQLAMSLSSESGWLDNDEWELSSYIYKRL